MLIKHAKIYNIIMVLAIVGLLAPNFSSVYGQDQLLTPPENMEEVKELGEKALETTQKEMPGLVEKIFKEEVLPIWQKMYDWVKANICPKIESFFQKFIKPEIEKRKPVVEEEFEKEKQEMKEEVKNTLPQILQSLWEKFKDIISTD